MATIYVFASSLVIAIVIFTLKAFEIRSVSGKQNPVLALIGKLDPKAIYFIEWLRFRALQAIQTVRYIIVVELRGKILNYVNHTKDKLLHEYKIRQELVMGRRVITNKGSVSFYLKKIAAEKEHEKRGRIE